MTLPASSRPCMFLMALSIARCSVKVTNPNPRGRPVSLSVMIYNTPDSGSS
ncbi:hypothetical protein QJS04_geneDACA013066 [Acorus gramineus]|uniref:Uncharacterized protein n=1 Tax=Acorus gramineus TaxID=55184 RepID=A0AAV9B248_ACOGR|nr:hypothetical protein QJS04_geneDACA013066 [Acorus gramineus]